MTTSGRQSQTDPHHFEADSILAREALIARLRRQVDELAPMAELVTVRNAEVATLRARLEATLAARRLEAETLRRRVDELERVLVEATRRADEATELEATLTRVEGERRAAVAAAERAAEAAAAAAGDAAGDGAARALADALARVASLEAALAAARRPTTIDGGYAAADAGFRLRLEERIAAWKRVYGRRIEAQREALEEKERLIAELATRANPPPPPVDPGDLTLIRGIGADLADTLRSLGYETLGDIAALTPMDLERIDASLTAFRGRARRDRWIEQAAELLATIPNRIDQGGPNGSR